MMGIQQRLPYYVVINLPKILGYSENKSQSHEFEEVNFWRKIFFVLLKVIHFKDFTIYIVYTF